jgi:hypothetical protein
MAVLDEGGNVLYLNSLPIIKVGKDNSLDVKTFRNTLHDLTKEYSETILVEPAQKFSPGKLALCSTWFCWGMIRAILEIDKYKWEPVNPRTWQKEMFSGHIRSKDQTSKDASIIVCQRIFPKTSLLPTPKTKKPNSGWADSLLLAEFGRLNR